MRQTAFLAVAVVLSVGASAAETAGRGLGLTVAEDGTLIKDGRPYRAIGVNYFNAFSRHLKDPKDTGYEEGFRALAEAGIPFARMMGCGFWPSEQKPYLENKDEFFRRFDDVVKSAEKHGVGLIPSLFWHIPTAPDLVGEPVSEWGNTQSKTHDYLRNYVKDVVTRYKDSPAIWGWEFGNEFNLGANLPNAAEHRPQVVPQLGTPKSRSEKDEWTYEIIRTAFAAFAAEVRKYDSYRAISTGDAFPRDGAWHNWKEKKWTKDTPEQFAEMLLGDNPDPVSIVSVHAYGDEGRRIRQAQPIAAKARKPLFVGEFGAPGPQEKGEAEFQSLLSAIEESHVPLAALWVYDFIGQKEWSVTATNERSYQLRAIGEANKRIRAALAAESAGK
ncbi:MAG: cellulase family glycosylhydrolase [Planctomycetota bacterium]|nr:cellulase family glycosylhydrolase [Planctomycetota bacterium]